MYLIIVCFSLLVHLPGVTSPLLDYQAYRQCQTASMARNYAHHGMHFLEPEIDTEGKPARAGTEFPIYSYLLAILYKIFGVHETLGRILSSVFAAWGAVFLYLFVRPRLGEIRAVGSALVMCVIPIHVYFTRSVQPEPMALWGFLGFLYYLDKWLNRGGGTRDWALAILLGAVAPLLKLPMMYVVLPLLGYLGWERFGWRAVGCSRLLSTLIGILALTAAWYHYAKSAPVGVLPLTVQEHWENLRPIFTWNLWRNHFISRLPELCLTYPGLLFAPAGAVALHKEGKLRLWGAWFAATSLYIVLLGAYGVTHRYTELPWAPVNAVLIASGIAALWEKHGSQFKWRVWLAILVIGMPLHAGLRIGHWYRWEYPWVFRAREAVASVSQPDDLVITNTREHPVLLYYINRFGFAPALEEMGSEMLPWYQVKGARSLLNYINRHGFPLDIEETGSQVLARYQTRGARLLLTPTDEGWERHPEWAPALAKSARLIHQDPDFLLFQLNPLP